VQARAARLPGCQLLQQFIYTSPTARPPAPSYPTRHHVYNNQPSCTADISISSSRADYHKMQWLKRGARQSGNPMRRPGRYRDGELLRHGLGIRKYVQCPAEPAGGEHFLDITRSRNRAARWRTSELVKARSSSSSASAKLRNRSLPSTRPASAWRPSVPDFRQDFTVVDDLDNPVPCPASRVFSPLAGEKSPISARQAAVEQQRWEIKSSRAALAAHPIRHLLLRHQCQRFALHTPKATATLVGGQAQLNHSHLDLGRGAAAGEAVRSCASSQANRRSQPHLSPTPRQPQTRSTLRAVAANSQIASCAIPSTFPPTASASRCLRYRPARFRCLEVVDAQDLPWSGRAMRMTTAWCATVSPWRTFRLSRSVLANAENHNPPHHLLPGSHLWPASKKRQAKPKRPRPSRSRR